MRIDIFNAESVIRRGKILVLVFFGLYAGLVSLGNMVDPESNLVFIKHVLSMDTTFNKAELMGRAIHSEALYTAALWVIVIIETFICLLCMFGAWRLFRTRHADADAFHSAKGIGLCGLILALALWFAGFQAVGGEWFASWQSAQWNGFEPAGRIMNFLFGALIFVSLKND